MDGCRLQPKDVSEVCDYDLITLLKSKLLCNIFCSVCSFLSLSPSYPGQKHGSALLLEPTISIQSQNVRIWEAVIAILGFVVVSMASRGSHVIEWNVLICAVIMG